MISYLVDINVWLALSWEVHPHSGEAHRWLASLDRDQTQLLFCRITQLGLLRLLTNELVMGGSVLPLPGALETFDAWCDDPRVEFVREPPDLEEEFRQVCAEHTKYSATKALMDAYLAAFAAALGASLITFDKALGAMARRHNVRHKVLNSRVRS